MIYRNQPCPKTTKTCSVFCGGSETQQRCESLGKLVATRGLFALEVAGEIYYPTFYLQLDTDRKKYERVCKALGGISGWSKWQFFTRPKGSLGDKTPLQALKYQDSLEAVVTSAMGFAER